jgi:AsmA protein
MKGLFKVLGIAVGVIVALVIVAAIWLFFIFDPNDFKQTLSDTVSEQTGRELRIDGDIGLSFFPWLAVRLGPASLSNAEGFGNEPFVAIEGARMGVRLLPLLSRNIELDLVRLDGLRLNLMVDERGNNNWDDLGGEEAAPAAPGAETESAGIGSLRIGGLIVSDANIRYTDKQAGQSVAVEDFNLKTGEIAAGAPIDFDVSVLARLEDSGMTAKLGLDSTIEYSDDFERFEMASPAVDLLLSGKDLPGGEVPVSLRMDRFAADLGKDTMSLEALTAEAMGLTFRAALAGTAITSSPRITGEFSLDEFSPRALMERLQMAAPVTADDAVLKKARAKGTIALTDNSAELSALEFVLDDTKLAGKAGITNLEKQSIRFDLAVDQIDADRYLPPVEEDAEEQQVGGDEDMEIPVDTLRDLDAEGTFRIGSLKISGIALTDVTLGLTAGNGKMRLKPVDVSLYQGKATGEITLDASVNPPTLTLRENLSGVQLGKLSEDAIERALVTGSANGKVALDARGATVNAMRNSLSGDLGFEVTDGAVEGIDFVYAVRLTRSLYRKQMPPSPPRPQRTPFERLSVSATAENGVLQSDDLQVFMPVLRVTGQGNVNLVESTLDYEVVTTVIKVPEDGTEQEFADLVGTSIPMRISGPLDDPKIAPDLSGLVRKQVEDVLKSDDVKEEIKEKTEELKDKLKGLFGN